ncbi:branched-chain amino acid transport system II carrier protein [Clostridium rectalis]|uniref:branched-chain amino acid transport system II carrier protein n=1 Tax=Clostridium rectalis TaxID=2040295 RepID=UPI000F631711|nr:branched-chain amino acid transport system II carrier protein [Clostridium rectalis]
MKKTTKDYLVIGLALFAMFFGAGNLVFPPYLGKDMGTKFIIGAIGFVLTGVGLPFLAILACTRNEGSFENMAGKVSRKFAVLCAVAIFLAIGPMLAIPRTAATTYELTVQPMFPAISSLLSMILYFALNLCFVLKPSKIIDNIGKFLTPLLLIVLSIIIIKGILCPIGSVINTNVQTPLSTSLIEGYQTMDALAALMFATIITSSVIDKGYKGKDIITLTTKAGIVAIVGLALVYGGLMYLGAQTSSMALGEITKTSLLLKISQMTLGSYGSIVIGIAIGLACFTTSVGLITAGANFFDNVSDGKLPYKINAIVISLVSIVIGTFGVDKIVKISVPVLSILYPVAITLVLINLFKNLSKNSIVVKTSVYTALTVSLLDSLPNLGINIRFLKSLFGLMPLSSMGFGWVTPTIIALILSLIISQVKKNNSEEVLENRS